jgi:hypothetical protein
MSSESNRWRRDAAGRLSANRAKNTGEQADDADENVVSGGASKRDEHKSTANGVSKHQGKRASQRRAKPDTRYQACRTYKNNALGARRLLAAIGGALSRGGWRGGDVTFLHRPCSLEEVGL